MDRKIKLLFVDDEKKFLVATTERLRLRNIEVFAFSEGQAALEATDDIEFDVALLDLKMPGMSGDELLKEIKIRHPEMEVVILTGHGTIDSAVDSMQQGAYEFLQKPCELDDLISVLSKAYAKKIQNQKQEKSKRVEALLERAVGLSPVALLEELRRIDKE